MVGMFKLCLALLSMACISNLARAAPSADLITNLPGLKHPVSFKQYSGFLEVGDGGMLQYWFVESEKDPATAPITLWLQGGPGFSSLYGFFTENGPFRVKSNGKDLYKNDYSWNKVSNMLYLDSPAGVGFSYSKTHHYATGDKENAKNNALALKAFFKKFPEYVHNELYLSGEDYAGFFIPVLASELIDHPQYNLNVKGFLISNGMCSLALEDSSIYYYAFMNGFISHTMWARLLEACSCGKSASGHLCDFRAGAKTSKECKKLLDEGLNNLNKVDCFNIYGDLLKPPTPGNVSCDTLEDTMRQMPGGVPWGKVQHRLPVKACVKDIAPPMNYLNSPEVRKALHIPNGTHGWAQMTGFPYKTEYEDMVAQYKKAMGAKLKIMVVGGDFNAMSNYVEQEAFVESLHSKSPEESKPWYYTGIDGKKHVGGFYRTWGRIMSATVRGAGHWVAQDRPDAALALLENYLKWKLPEPAIEHNILV